ncbi:MAG TPA: hypothetical protein VK550_21975 [Polyangiaceae bacterium]|nr:hypothetical protein [Polyangiaceae bacterium]
MKRCYFLAAQEPAPQPPSLPGFFLPAGVAPGFAPGAGAAPGLEAVVGVAGGGGVAGAGDAIVGGEGAAGAVAGDAGIAGVEVSAAGVIGAAGAGVAGVVEAGVLGSGADPPQAATPNAAAANPKILFLSVISIAFPPSLFRMRVPFDSRVSALRPHV